MFETLSPPYDAIVADPPWRFASNSVAKPGRNALRHYDCLPVANLCAMPVASLAADNCALFLWITGPFLAIGAHCTVMRAWGFKPSGIAFTWVKLNKSAASLFLLRSDLSMGGGFTTRKNAEFCIMGKRGRSIRQDKGVHEVILAVKREHSRKPAEFYKRVRQYVGPDARVCDLFARDRYQGIDPWGHEVDKFAA
jgi:N6-adenosine-specific RNA methylase IME4